MDAWIDEVRQRLAAEFGDKPAICVMATVDTNGRPTARCMVCREIDNTGHFVFASDRRTGKDDHLRACPDTEICFWLSKLQVQLRVRGVATVVDAEADTFMREQWWDRLPPENRSLFTSSGQAQSGDQAMPQTFELIVVDASEIELQDLSTRPQQKRVWKDSSKQWEPLGA